MPVRLAVLLSIILPVAMASAQTGTVAGQVIARDGGQPLGYVGVLLPSRREVLSGADGRFSVTVPAGEVRLRFRRIGFAATDTVLRLAANDTARVLVSLDRLVIQLPEMVVSGKCLEETPREPVPGFLSQLMDQVRLNAERMALLAEARPFAQRVERIDGELAPDGTFTPTRGDTSVRTNVLPDPPYAPKKVMFRLTSGPHRGAWGIKLPELSDFADTAFTNNHCFTYAGRTTLEGDSVVQVQFGPVPWLDKEYDINGTLYLKADGYQIVRAFTRLNHLRPEGYRAGLEEYFVDAWFREIVPGIPILDRWDTANRPKNPSRPSIVERSRVLEVLWKDSSGVRTRQRR
jgi:hypothetical protein